MGNIFRCCGQTGKPASRAVAYIDLTIAFLGLLAGFLLLTSYPGQFVAKQEGDTKLGSTPNIVTIIIFIAVFFVECCLGALLLSAARNKDANQCDNWFKIRLILLCVFVFALIYCLSGAQLPLIIFVGGGLGLVYILYRVYTLMIVKFFQNEIENNFKIALEVVQKA